MNTMPILLLKQWNSALDDLFLRGSLAEDSLRQNAARGQEALRALDSRDYPDETTATLSDDLWHRRPRYHPLGATRS